MHRTEEAAKVAKLQREKPLVYEKMQKFDEKIARGESIAIIRFEYRYACNLTCGHCCIRDLQAVRDVRMLKPSDVESVAMQADALGLARFVLTGGEPLILPDLDRVIEAMMPERFYINLDTNGWLLNRSMAGRLKSLGVDRIQLSIDSLHPAVHDAFRGKVGSHARAMSAIDTAHSAGLDLFVQTVVTKQRLYSEEFVRFVQYFNRIGVGVFVTFIKPVGAAKDLKDELCGVEDFAYFGELERKHNLFWHLTPGFGRDVGCIASKGMVSITSFGDVNGCLYIHKPIGNIFKETLDTILHRAMKTPPWDKKILTCPAADRDWAWE